MIGLLIFLLGVFILVGVWAHVDSGFLGGLQESVGDELGGIPSISGLMAGGILGGIIILSAYLFVAFVVRAIVKTTVDGNPFVSENISRLRKTWIVIILAEIIRMAASGFMNGSMTTQDGNVDVDFEFRLQAWVLALFIAIMAEVFRIGLELKRDQELTV